MRQAGVKLGKIAREFGLPFGGSQTGQYVERAAYSCCNLVQEGTPYAPDRFTPPAVIVGHQDQDRR